MRYLNYILPTQSLIGASCSFFLLLVLACQTSQPTQESNATGLVQKVEAREIKISGTKSARLDNEQLQARFFLVRHAEKDTVGRDPSLLPAGQARAKRLSEILGEVPLRRVYATNYQRTQLTAAPTAQATHLTTQTYAPSGQNALLDQLLEQAAGGNYLLVGHSNTVPKMLNYLSGKSAYQNISEKTYDGFYVVSVYRDGRVAILELQY